MKQAETLQKQLETLLAQQYQYEVKSREDKKTLEYLPLPPYVKDRQDFEYYQNEIGTKIGSVAAPTASHHRCTYADNFALCILDVSNRIS